MNNEIINLAKNSYKLNNPKTGYNIDQLKKDREQFISNITLVIQKASSNKSLVSLFLSKYILSLKKS